MIYRLLVVFVVLLTACGRPPTDQASGAPAAPAEASSQASTSPMETTTASGTEAASGSDRVLRLVTTTSTEDSGLLDAILPDFEQRYGADVQVVAVGTGQALELGANGDTDVVLVHARAREDEFVANGFGINRRDVMYNDFVIVGPSDDPADVGDTHSASDAFARIAEARAIFASRGDDSGTFTKEQAIWSSAGITPTAALEWYKSLGQGMGETLITANELGAYTLADRGTYLSMRDAVPNLTVVFGGDTIDQNPDPTLHNPYGVIQVNPERFPQINAELAAQFVEWITSPETQQVIGEFGQAEFGQPLFYPQAQQ